MMAEVFAEVVKIHEELRFSALTVGKLYRAHQPQGEARVLGYDFEIYDDLGQRSPFNWDNDVEADFERHYGKPDLQ